MNFVKFLIAFLLVVYGYSSEKTVSCKFVEQLNSINNNFIVKIRVGRGEGKMTKRMKKVTRIVNLVVTVKNLIFVLWVVLDVRSVKIWG